ncbi:MAG: PAS-domain containing protein [Gammaproteobacteria bacterium]|nr:PAS-domain containing protein [Gammaproteobacteria bacterium]
MPIPTVWLVLVAPFLALGLWYLLTSSPYSTRELILLATAFVASTLAALFYLRSHFLQSKHRPVQRIPVPVDEPPARPAWQWGSIGHRARDSERHAADLMEIRLLAALDVMPHGLAFYNAEQRLVMCNASFQAMLGLPPEWVKPGTPWARHRQILDDWTQPVLLDGTPAAALQLPDKRWIQWLEHRVPRPYTLVLITDVTELVRQETQHREKALAEKSALLQMTVDHLGQGLSVFDKDLNIVVWNNRFFELLGIPNDLKQRPTTFEEMVRFNAYRGEYGPGDVEQQVAERLALAHHPVPHHFERLRSNGTALEIRGNPLPDGGFVTVYADITERKRLEEQLRLAATVLDTTSEGIAITDAFHRIESVNPAFMRLTGYPEAQLAGRRPFFFNNEHFSRAQFRALRRTLITTEAWRGEIRGRRKNGEAFVAWLSLASIKNANGAIVRYVGVFHDITLHKEDQERIWRQANFDLLTNLPNRYLFMDRLLQAEAQANRMGQRFALLFLDLDGFKAVNDTYGHAAGDSLLQTMGQRLYRCIRASDTLARLAGDEFTALLLNLNAPEQAVRVAEKFLRAMNRPVVLDSGTATVSGSIGIAIYPQHANDVETLLRQADAAMYKAKRQGKNRFHLAAGPAEGELSGQPFKAQ